MLADTNKGFNVPSEKPKLTGVCEKNHGPDDPTSQLPETKGQVEWGRKDR